MKTFPAIVAFGLVCLSTQVMSGPLMPAYVDAETGEAFIRVPGPVDRVRRQVDQYPDADTSYGAPAPGPLGRVKIQVYRGPSKGEGYDVFAPWGYYNTQPADAGHGYGHH